MAEELQAQTILEEVPPPRGPSAAGSGMLPEIVEAQIEFFGPDVASQKSHESTHQWETYEEAGAGVQNITVEGGTITYQDTVLQVGGLSFAEPTKEWDIWCAITLGVDGVPTKGTIGNGSLATGPPADTATLVHRRLAEIFNAHPAPPSFYGKIRQLQFEPIRMGEAGASGDHMWKVVDTDPGGLSPATTYSVAGGIAVIQGTRVSVADKTDLAASGGTGFVVLKVTRVAASRVYDPAYPPVIEFHSTTLPPSTYTAEYTVLAETLAVLVPAVLPGGPQTYRHDITQCRRDEICSYERLGVANGEFVLLPMQANSRNSYAPPLP